MKILHTSDWHLGQEFYSYDRTEEHEAFLSQLQTIVTQEQPDVMVVSGDIYHNATPSNAVMRLFTDRLEQICRACPTMQVVVTAGNHDSSSRLEVTRTLWEHLGVKIIGHIEKNDNRQVDFDRHIIGIHNKEGALCGYVVAIPHVFAHSFPLIEADTPREERQSVFFHMLANRVKEVNTAGVPVVLMLHMALTGSDITGHDEMRGGMEYTDIASLEVEYDYLALGHIHCPQRIGKYPARYCGSPIPVSFDEDYPHSVTIVDIPERGADLVLRTIPINNPWPLRTIPSEAVSFEEALNALAGIPDDEQAYIRLHVRLSDVAPHNAIERAMQITEGKHCRFCCFKWERPAQTSTTVRTFTDVDQMKSQSPLDIANLYYTNKFGRPMGEELERMFSEVVAQIGTSEK